MVVGVCRAGGVDPSLGVDVFGVVVMCESGGLFLYMRYN